MSSGENDQMQPSRRVLRFVGAFQEFGYAGGPSLKSSTGKRSHDDVEAVANYVERGQPMVVRFGLHRDVFDRTKHAGPLHILTDGTFAWHRALAYYVRVHRVELPKDFEAHMLGLGFRCPNQSDAHELALPTARGES